MALSSGSTEVAMPFGGDIQMDATGDFQLLQDSVDESPATLQRVNQLVMTNPILKSDFGVILALPDDLCNPDYGLGLGRVVGQNVTPALLDAVQAAYAKALATEPGVSRTPPPSVSVTDLGSGLIQIVVEIATVAGRTVALPSTVFSVVSGTLSLSA
jgi:phage baseplate assembly protein W